MLSMGGRELSEYGLPQPQTVDNDRFARVYRREIKTHDSESQGQAICNERVSYLHVAPL